MARIDEYDGLGAFFRARRRIFVVQGPWLRRGGLTLRTGAGAEFVDRHWHNIDLQIDALAVSTGGHAGFLDAYGARYIEHDAGLAFGKEPVAESPHQPLTLAPDGLRSG